MRKANKIFWILLAVIVISVIGARVFLWSKGASTVPENNSTNIAVQYEIETIPAYSGDPYIEIDNNQPSFSEGDLTSKAFEHYSELDSLGRCGPAYANVGPETMPEEERGPIGEIHPSGWQVANYHELIDGNYLYNRCHLIAFSLTGENANEKNLITGTRYLNTEGMQPFELKVLEYVRSTGNHVLYRVRPIFEGDNLVASGVEMEGYSVEDEGKEVSFHIYAYNVQPGVIIDYKTGDNHLDSDYVTVSDKRTREKTIESPEEETSSDKKENDQGSIYILNKNTHKFHDSNCPSVSDIKEKNKEISKESRDAIISKGYEPCDQCKP